MLSVNLHLRNGLVLDKHGNKLYYFNNELHRTDGPALEYSNGHKEWFQYGKLHRTDGPAIEWAEGTKEWRQNGLVHRTDGPAIEYSNGVKAWYLEGKELTEDQFNSQSYREFTKYM